MTIVLVLHLSLCVFLAGVILLQPGKSDAGIGFGSSSSQSIFGSRGAGNFLTRTTTAVAVLFLLTSFYFARQRIQANQGLDIGEIAPEETSIEGASSGEPGSKAGTAAAGAGASGAGSGTGEVEAGSSKGAETGSAPESAPEETNE